MPKAQHLLIVSQVYPPDPAAVGQQIGDVGEDMVKRGWSVTVYASAWGYDDPSMRYPSHEVRHGVQVRRLGMSSFGKKSLAWRLLGQGLFMLQAFGRACLGRRPNLILASTSPPFAGFFGALLSRLRGAPFVWWLMDLNPDQAIAAGAISVNAPLARIFRWMNRFTARHAAEVVALDHHMARRLTAQGAVARSVTVLPPWPHVSAAGSRPDGGRAFRRVHGIGDELVVMYSGNHALQHPLTTLLDAAQELRADRRVRFVFIGGGAGKRLVEERIAEGQANLLSLPYQPFETLEESLSAADVHVVTMGDDMVGIVHPCKIYGAMAVGRPILFFGPIESHVSELITHRDVGWVVAHGDVPAATKAITAAIALSPATRAQMGARAAGIIINRFSQQTLRHRFCGLLEAAASSGK